MNELLDAIKELTSAVKENTEINKRLVSAIREDQSDEEDSPSEYMDGTPTPVIDTDSQYL